MISTLTRLLIETLTFRPKTMFDPNLRAASFRSSAGFAFFKPSFPTDFLAARLFHEILDDRFQGVEIV